LHDPILADLQVRKAISTALDIDSMIKQAVNGVGIRTCDEDLGTFAHEPDVTCYPFDQATAKSVLDADGWAMGSDGYRHKNGKILELNWSTTSNNARRAQTQQIGQQNLKDIGIKINIKDFPADALFGTILPSGQYQIGEFTNSLGYDPDDFTSWGCNQTAAQGGGNWTYYCNQAVDAALHAEQQNPDQNARLEQFKIFHQAMLTDLPVVYVYSYGAPAVAGNNVHNYNPSAQGPSETWNVWTWYKS
jgi:peptide/nickel transport system substrate-binding protein